MVKPTKRRWITLFSMAVVFALVVPLTLWAPPPRHGRAPARRAVRPGPPKHRPAKPLPPKARSHRLRRARFARHPRYWHVVYPPRRAEWIWHRLGYRYYVGGTDYVILPSATAEQTTTEPNATIEPNNTIEPTAIAEPTEQQKRLEQIQELIDLIHEWRTLNESPELHNRLPQTTTDENVLKTLQAISEKNQQFDQTTRQAMDKLSQAQSAQTELETATTYLEKLIELAESLPPKTPEPTIGY